MTENTTASGAADDSLLICASDLQHSAIYDTPREMVDCIRAVADRITALAASAPVAPAPQPAVPEGFVLVPVEPTEEMEAAAYRNSSTYGGGPGADYRAMIAAAPKADHIPDFNAALKAAPVAPTQPMPYPTDAQIDAVYEQTMGQHLRSQDAPAVRRFGRAMFLCAWNAAAPKADQIEDGLAMVPAPLQPDWCELRRLHALAVADADADRILAEWRAYKPAPLQQGEYPETLYEGGRESVDDALAVVESFGPGVQGLNDTFARQVLLGQEVRRLRAAYEHACQGRSDFRNLYRAARGAAQASPAKHMVIDWPLYNKDPVLEMDDIYADYSKSFGITPGPVMAKIVQRHQARLQSWFGGHREAIRSALVDKARAQAAQQEGCAT